jgi:hypothetical protein
MDFPHPVERQTGYDRADLFSPVLVVRPQVREIEDNAAIGRFRDHGEKIAVRHFERLPAEVIDAGLERHRPPERCGAPGDVGGGELHLRLRLQRRHQEPAGPRSASAFHVQDAQVLAGPRRFERLDPAPKQRDMAFLIADRAAQRIADAVSERPLREPRQPLEFGRTMAKLAEGARSLGPERLRLDLGDPDQVAVGPKDRVETPEIDRAWP